MKKITLLLMSLSFVLASFAQTNIKNVSTTTAPLKMNTEQIATENVNPTIFAETAIGPDTLWPQAYYQGCWDNSFYYLPFSKNVDGVYENYYSGSNSLGFGLHTMAFIPKFHNDRISIVPLEAPLGGNRKVTAALAYIVKNPSSLVESDTISISAFLSPAVRTSTWESFASGAGEEQIYIPDVDKMQESAPVKLWPVYNSEGKSVIQRKIFNFATPLATDAPFTITVKLPWNDSTANASLFMSKDGCIGTEIFAATVATSVEPDDFWIGDPLATNIFPESSIQNKKQMSMKNEKGEDIRMGFFSSFAVSALFGGPGAVGRQHDFQFRPIINTVTANDNSNDLKFQASVYPTPAKKELTVISAVEMNNISIFNMAGQKVKNVVPSNSMEQVINVEDLTNGLYIVKMDTKQGPITKKIMISK